MFEICYNIYVIMRYAIFDTEDLIWKRRFIKS